MSAVGVQNVATLILVAITGVYVWLVHRQNASTLRSAEAAERAARAAEESLRLLSADARARTAKDLAMALNWLSQAKAEAFLLAQRLDSPGSRVDLHAAGVFSVDLREELTSAAARMGGDAARAILGALQAELEVRLAAGAVVASYDSELAGPRETSERALLANLTDAMKVFDDSLSSIRGGLAGTVDRPRPFVDAWNDVSQ